MAAVRKRYLNRELSWLEFNYRVLEEAMDETYPLLERVKFLSIFYQNLDEFFMIRVSGLIEQAEAGMAETSPDGLSSREQLALVRRRVGELTARAEQYLQTDLFPALAQGGIHIYDYADLK